MLGLIVFVLFFGVPLLVIIGSLAAPPVLIAFSNRGVGMPQRVLWSTAATIPAVALVAGPEFDWSPVVYASSAILTLVAFLLTHPDKRDPVAA